MGNIQEKTIWVLKSLNFNGDDLPSHRIEVQSIKDNYISISEFHEENDNEEYIMHISMEDFLELAHVIQLHLDNNK